MRELLDRRGGKFSQRVCTERERAEISNRSAGADSPESAETLHTAGKFAAKEALLKALGTGLAGGISWTDVEVLSGNAGAPSVELTGRAGQVARELGVTRIHLSISHSAASAVAVAILEGE
jgi:holo-[acyl-carrier protein] synthase